MLRDAKSKRIPSNKLDDDKVALDALKTLKDFAPNSGALSLENIVAAYEAMSQNQTAEIQAKIAFDTQRDVTLKSEHAFHDLMIRAYDAVRGQYGRDSAQVQAMGRKRVSEYKRPTQKKPVSEEKQP